MRSFVDEDKKIAWIFDEKTHPLGNDKPMVAIKSPLDLNNDGVVDKKDAAIAGSVLEKFKPKKGR